MYTLYAPYFNINIGVMLDIVKGLLQYSIQEERLSQSQSQSHSQSVIDTSCRIRGSESSPSPNPNDPTGALTVELEYYNRGSGWHDFDTASYLQWFVLAICRQKHRIYTTLPKPEPEPNPPGVSQSSQSSLGDRRDRRDRDELLDDSIQADYISSLNIGLLLCIYSHSHTHTIQLQTNVSDTGSSSSNSSSGGSSSMGMDMDILKEIQFILFELETWIQNINHSRGSSSRGSSSSSSGGSSGGGLLQMNITSLLERI